MTYTAQEERARVRAIAREIGREYTGASAALPLAQIRVRCEDAGLDWTCLDRQTIKRAWREGVRESSR